MRARILGAAAAACIAASPAYAQPASPCDKLAGEEQKRCLRLQEERRQEQERLGREEAETPRDCDRLFGPEKELCLRRGGTVRAGSAPTGAAGGTAAPQAR
jgi:hypothetical protein